MFHHVYLGSRDCCSRSILSMSLSGILYVFLLETVISIESLSKVYSVFLNSVTFLYKKYHEKIVINKSTPSIPANICILSTRRNMIQRNNT